VIPAVGSRALGGLAETLPGAELDGSGRVKVDKWLRPSALPNVFAAGDVAAAGDAMTIVAISRQKPWLEKTLKTVAGGKPVEETKPYAPWGKAPIVLPLGPERGNTFLRYSPILEQGPAPFKLPSAPAVGFQISLLCQ